MPHALSLFRLVRRKAEQRRKEKILVLAYSSYSVLSAALIFEAEALPEGDIVAKVNAALRYKSRTGAAISRNGFHLRSYYSFVRTLPVDTN